MSAVAALLARLTADYQLLPPQQKAVGRKVRAAGRFYQVSPPAWGDKDLSRRAKDDGPYRPIDWPINGIQKTP